MAGAYQTALAALSPVAWWKLDEAAAATTVADSSGNGQTGTVQTSIVSTGSAGPNLPGLKETVASGFANNDANIQFTAAAALTAALQNHDFAFTCWGICPSTFVNSGPYEWAQMQVGTNTATHSFAPIFLSSVLGSYTVDNGSGLANTMPRVDLASLNWNAWHHYVLSYAASTNTFTVFIDGVQVGTFVAQVNITGTNGAVGMNRAIGSNQAWTNGSLSNVAVIASQVTPAQVFTLYSAALPALAPTANCTTAATATIQIGAQYVGSTVGTLTSGSSAATGVVNKPAGVQAGDLILIHVGGSGKGNIGPQSGITDPALVVPTGFTSRYFYCGSGNNWLTWLMYRVADGTEGTSFTATVNGSTGSVVAGGIECLVLRGIDQTYPFAAQGATYSQDVSSVTVPSVASPYNAISLIADVASIASSTTVTWPSGYSAVGPSSNSGAGMSTYLGYNLTTVAPGTMPAQTLTQGATAWMIGLQYALRLAGQAGISLTVVQSVENESNTATLPTATTSGNTLVIGLQLFGQSGGATIPNVTALGASGVNAFTLDTASQGTVPGQYYGMRTVFYYCTNIVGEGSFSVNFTTDIGSYDRVQIWELTPCGRAGGSTNHAQNSTSNPTLVDAGTLTPSAGGGFIGLLENEDGNGNDYWNPGPQWNTTLHSGAGSGGTWTGYAVAGTNTPVDCGVPYTASGINWVASAILFDPPTPVAITASAQATTSATATVTTTPAYFVQGIGNFTASVVTSLAQAFGSNVTAGNLIVVAVANGLASPPNYTVTDSQGNTYQYATFGGQQYQTNANMPHAGGIAYAIAGSSGPLTVTYNLNVSTSYVRLGLHEYTGVNALDQTSGASAAGTLLDPGSVTTLHPNEVAFGWLISNAGDTPPPVPPAIQRLDISSELTEDEWIPTAGPADLQANASSAQWLAVMATFYQSGPAPVPITASAAARGSATVALSAGTSLTATASAVSAGVATLHAPSALQATAASQTAAVATAIAQGVLVPTAQATAQAVVALTAQVTLAPQLVQATTQAVATVLTYAVEALLPVAAAASQAALTLTAQTALTPTATATTAATSSVTAAGITFITPQAQATAQTTLTMRVGAQLSATAVTPTKALVLGIETAAYLTPVAALTTKATAFLVQWGLPEIELPTTLTFLEPKSAGMSMTGHTSGIQFVIPGPSALTIEPGTTSQLSIFPLAPAPLPASSTSNLMITA